MSPFSKPTIEPPERWLKLTKAAEILGFDVRTIKRMMQNPTGRKILGAVRLGKHGKPWRIPLPADEGDWEAQTDSRLKAVGVQKSSWQRGLEKHCKKSARYNLESFRLWLAACIKALKQGRVTEAVRKNLLLLWQTACKVLDTPTPLKRYEIDVENFKSHFSAKLRERPVSVKSVMHHWPKKEHFEILRKAHTRADLEKIRRELDFWQAYRDELRRRRGGEPTAESLCRLLHKDLITHINDTRDALPPGTIKPRTPEELRCAVETDCRRKCELLHNAIWKELIVAGKLNGTVIGSVPAGPLIDLRQPQNGISLRTFRTRYPRRQQKPIIAKVRRILSELPSADEKPDDGKTPVRGG